MLGRELRVKSAALPEVVHEIEGFVNGKLAEAACSVKGGDVQVISILALMTIAEAYLSLLKQQGMDEAGRLHNLLVKVDKHL